MASHIMDNYQQCKKQCFDTAFIVDSKGNKVGKIIIRYTKSGYGYNNETGVLFYDAGLDFSNTEKGGVYNNMGVVKLLIESGVRCFDASGEQITLVNCQQYSRPTQLNSLKIGGKKYRVWWV